MTLLLQPQDAALSVPAEAPARAHAISAINPIVRGAFYLFLASIPFEMPHRNFPIEIPTLTGFIFLFVTFLDARACYRRFPRSLGWFLLHGWFLFALFFALPPDYPDVAINWFVNMAQLLWLYWVITNILADGVTLRGALYTIVFSTTARAFAQVSHLAATPTVVWTGGERESIFGQNPNLAAIIMSVGVIVAAGLFLTKSRALPRIGIAALPIGACLTWAIVQTGSRGGMLCVVAGLVLYMFSGRTLVQKLRNGFLGLIAMAALVFAATQSSMMRARIENAADNDNLAGRQFIYPAAIHMFIEKPLIGWGVINNQVEIGVRIGEKHKPMRDAHNLFLDTLTSAGILGSLPFFIGLAMVFRDGWRARKGPLGLVPLAILLAVFVGCMSGTWIESKIIWLAFAIPVAAGSWWPETSLEDRWHACAA